VEAAKTASDAGVVILMFTPHTSDNLTVFGSLKTYYFQSTEAWPCNHPRQLFDVHNMAIVLGKAYPHAFSTSNIISGFRQHGIYPMDWWSISEADFLASRVTDRPPTEAGFKSRCTDGAENISSRSYGDGPD
jgi:hypothetical protein